MIKYLSGDLSQEESRSFVRELAGDPQLEKEFSQVSSAFRMIGAQLRRRDEEAFSSALSTAMEKSRPGETPGKHRSGSWWYILLALAASVTVLVTIMETGRSTERIYAFCYKPSEDPVLETIREETRGEADHIAAALWQEGDYEQCRRVTADQLSENPGDRYAMLFNLLSSMEMDETGTLPKWVETAGTGTGTTLDRAISWYGALALVKAGETSGALALLTHLEELPGPYQEDAHKLKKKLKKYFLL